ncbi:contractile injection system tape measure protein [Serratia liquefaciens]|uniref:contractile injection system tape measure protein n=1 Tax=Serratia liquefaciens TaxID=614 RepID=UPI0039061FA4
MTHFIVGSVHFKIKAPHRTSGEELLHSHILSADVIKKTLSQVVQEIGIVEVIKSDEWVLKLDDIPAALIDTLFIPRLKQAFAERLARENESIVGHHVVTMSQSDESESNVLLRAHHLDDEGLFQFALCCLTPSVFKTLLKDSPAYQLQRWLKLLLEGTWQSPKMLPVFWYSRVTASRLSIAAVLYLLKSQQGHDWLMSQHAITANQVTDWAKAIARGEIPPEQLALLLTGNRSSNSTLPEQRAYPPLLVMRWLLPLWRQPVVRQVIQRLKSGRGVRQIDAYLSRCLLRQDDAMREEQGGHTDLHQAALSRDHATLPQSEEMSAISRGTMSSRKRGFRSPNEPSSSSQGISNAGLLLLWPLLPQLFSQLGLWEEEQFVSDAAQWQAVYGLDRLVWGEASPMEGRLTLNQVLCGVSCSTAVPPPIPLGLLQLQQIDDWLAAIGQQLPGWQKLSMTDIRQLFLQRAGEISTEGPVPQISVWPEPYDFLLRDWPWPMTLASFPWTEQPLVIVWPLNGFTG